MEPAQYLGPRGVHRVMENKDGLHLQSYFWPAAEAKAVVLFVHGHGAHLMFEILTQTVRLGGAVPAPAPLVVVWRGACVLSCPYTAGGACDGRCARPRSLTPPLLLPPAPPGPQGLGKPMQYEGSWAQQWNQRGISLCGLDLQSCGRSEGKRGLRFYIDSFDDYVHDVMQLARWGGGSEGWVGWGWRAVVKGGARWARVERRMCAAWVSGGRAGGRATAPFLTAAVQLHSVASDHCMPCRCRVCAGRCTAAGGLGWASLASSPACPSSSPASLWGAASPSTPSCATSSRSSSCSGGAWVQHVVE